MQIHVVFSQQVWDEILSEAQFRIKNSVTASAGSEPSIIFREGNEQRLFPFRNPPENNTYCSCILFTF